LEHTHPQVCFFAHSAEELRAQHPHTSPGFGAAALHPQTEAALQQGPSDAATHASQQYQQQQGAVYSADAAAAAAMGSPLNIMGGPIHSSSGGKLSAAWPHSDGSPSTYGLASSMRADSLAHQPAVHPSAPGSSQQWLSHQVAWQAAAAAPRPTLAPPARTAQHSGPAPDPLAGMLQQLVLRAEAGRAAASAAVDAAVRADADAAAAARRAAAYAQSLGMLPQLPHSEISLQVSSSSCRDTGTTSLWAMQSHEQAVVAAGYEPSMVQPAPNLSLPQIQPPLQQVHFDQLQQLQLHHQQQQQHQQPQMLFTNLPPEALSAVSAAPPNSTSWAVLEGGVYRIN